MATRTIIEGKWDEAKGRIRERWGDLADDELEQARGNWEQLVGIIRQKTGESMNQVEDTLNDVLDSMLEPADENDRQTTSSS